MPEYISVRTLRILTKISRIKNREKNVITKSQQKPNFIIERRYERNCADIINENKKKEKLKHNK